jgi:lipopolysaccharide export system permease protein
MSLLDRYVGRIALGAFGAAQLFFLFLTIVIDLLNSLPRYIEKASAQGLGGLDLAIYLASFYAKNLPFLFITITPFVTVIACMFAVARLQAANEVVPMLFVGRGVQRVLRPMLLGGWLAAAGMAACWQWVVPRFGASLAEAQSLLREGDAVHKALVHEVHDVTSRKLYVREYDPRVRRMTGVQMLLEGQLAADVAFLHAAHATWDETRGDWRLERGVLERERRQSPAEWLERPDLSPELLLRRGREDADPELQSYTDLLEIIESRPNRADVRLALHRHVTYPLANLILLLLALPLAVSFERGSRIWRLLAAIGLCGAYMLFDLVCQSLGQHGHVHPIVAAWSPTILFGALGIVLFGSTKT